MKKILSKFFKKSDYQNMSLEDIDFTDLKNDDLIFILNKIGEQVRINPNNYELGRTAHGPAIKIKLELSFFINCTVFTMIDSPYSSS